MEVKLIQETCCANGCNVVFWILKEHYERLVSTRKSFYCPNGHSQSYVGESDTAKAIRLGNENARMRREVAEKEMEIEALKRKCIKKRKKKSKK